jgi:RNA-directed DNA polymerase
MNKASQITSNRSGLLWIPKTEIATHQWNSMNWKAVYKRINKIQARITKATQRGNRNLAKKLQYLLTSSFDAKLLAVRKVTSNKGKRTSGVDRQLSIKTSKRRKTQITKDTDFIDLFIL